MRWPRTREIWVASLMLTIVLVWAGRYFVNPDGISYLDLSDGFKSSDWDTIANSHWSPFYPLILATLIPSSLRWSPSEPIVVHVINGWLFLLALAAFNVFLAEIRESGQAENVALDVRSGPGRLAAYMVFLWCALVLITVRSVTPDMLLAGIGFAAAAQVVRIQSKRATTFTFVLLGALLGLAALTKSFMLSVSIVLLLALLITNPKILYSAVMFLIVISPQLFALSSRAGHLDFGSSAKVVYALKVNGVSKFDGAYELATTPLTVSFPTDKANQTYPLWDDPARWLPREPIRFDYSTQMEAFIRNLKSDAGIALKIVIPLIFIVLCRDWGMPVRNRLLASISLAVLAAYSLLHSEARLIGFWIALGSISFLTGVTLNGRYLKLGRRVIHLIGIISAISIITYAVDQSFSSRPDRGLNARDIQGEVAAALRETGLKKGDRIGLLGDESDIYWARLARVQIVTQVPLAEAPAYWSSSEGARDDINRWMGMAGAKVIVASWTSPPAPIEGWTPVPGSRYSIFPLKKQK
ncbi:MAG TPA: hypothetical protein VFD22_04620 [Gemmatimonadaceae bacterium]|nr:hypothetical protein [Gemmatimonadaceae bacterium]